MITGRRKLRNVETNDLFAHSADVREVIESVMGWIRSMQWTMSHYNTNKLHPRTQHFNAIQQCATSFGSSEPSSGTFITKVKKESVHLLHANSSLVTSSKNVEFEQNCYSH